MTKELRFRACVQWGSRPESPEELALRTRQLVLRLGDITPHLASWFVWITERDVQPVDFTLASLTKAIADKVSRDDFGNASPIGGYSFWAVNNDKPGFRPLGLRLMLHGGGPSRNFVHLDTDPFVTPDPSIVTYAIFKDALLAMSETFEPVWGWAYPTDLIDLWPEVPRSRIGPVLRLAWITYLSPQLARLISPPASAIVERRPDGGLLMAATKETFVTSNPNHLAVGREILEACAPLNALPWPPCT